MLKLGIIGNPLTHSLSPALHAELLRLTGRSGEYCKYEVSSEGLAGLLADFAQAGGRGLNVTIPHKVAVMPMMDRLGPEAELIGAVNTIVFEPRPDAPTGIYREGHNTDMAGFIRGIPQDVRERLPQARLLLLGAGGSARAVVAALLHLNVRALDIAARNPEKAALLLEQAQRIRAAVGVSSQLSVVRPDAPLPLTAYDGIINTTPLGMWPEVDHSPLSREQLAQLPAGAFVYDLIYRPVRTRLLREAEQMGLRAINGLDMLIFQGVCAFELWSGSPVSVEIADQVREFVGTCVREEHAASS